MIGEKVEASTVSWKEKAKECHEKRWEYLHSPMHAAGMALDPEFMERAADFDESTQEGLMTVVERLSLLDVIFESANPAAAQLTLTTESPKVAERISNTMTELAKYQANEGIFTKAHVMMAAKTMPPAVWWATYGKPLPLLSAVARRVLAQPVCASAAERNWSVYGKIKTGETSRMGHESADKRVYCHEALHLKEKLQSAGYKQDTVGWDTDENSDESEAEADLAV